VQYGYDVAGNTTAITTGDTSGNVIQVETQQYDALNRAITDTVAGPNGASPQTTTTRYDPDGNVYQVNQPTGATTVNTYDLADDLVTSETDGAPVLTATHQDQTTYRYDAAGNQVETRAPDGRDTTTTYDADNRVLQSVGITGTSTLTTTLGYDPDGNTLQTTTQTQSGTAPVQTSTDSATYNAADWTASATDNGVTTQYGYDANGRLVSWHDPGPGQNVTYGYAYDAASRVTTFTAVSGTDTLGYNAQNRLTSDCGPQVIAHSPDHCYHWTYDGTGNISTTTVDAGSPVTYTYTRLL